METMVETNTHGRCVDLELHPMTTSLLPGVSAGCSLSAGQTSTAIIYTDVDQTWYFQGGTGWLWKQRSEDKDLRRRAMRVDRGVVESIPRNTAFQLHNDGTDPLTIFIAMETRSAQMPAATPTALRLWPVDGTVTPSEYYDKLPPEKVSTVNTSRTGCRLIKEFIGTLAPKSRVLDAGCGGGAEAAIFIDAGHQVTGVDGAQHLVDGFKTTHRMPAHVGDICALDKIEALEPEEFDACHCSFVFIHLTLEQGFRALKQFHKRLKNGGKLFLATNVLVGRARMRWSRNDSAPNATCFFDWGVNDLLAAIKDAGFKLEAVALERHQKPDYEILPTFVTATRVPG